MLASISDSRCKLLRNTTYRVICTRVIGLSNTRVTNFHIIPVVAVFLFLFSLCTGFKSRTDRFSRATRRCAGSRRTGDCRSCAKMIRARPPNRLRERRPMRPQPPPLLLRSLRRKRSILVLVYCRAHTLPSSIDCFGKFDTMSGGYGWNGGALPPAPTSGCFFATFDVLNR